MSTNYHTPVVPGAALNVASVNNPMGQLDSAITGIINGTQPVNVLNLGFGADIATDAIGTYTVTHSVHRITITNWGDVLRTLNGGAEGDTLKLISEDVLSNRLIVDGTGGIIFYGSRANSSAFMTFEGNFELNFFYSSGDWYLFNMDSKSIHTTPLGTYPYLPYSSNWNAPDFFQRDEINIRPYNGTVVASGATLTTSGTLAHIAAADGVFTSFTQASLGANGGFYTNSVNVCDSRQNPMIKAILRFSQITDFRFWLGFTASATGPGNILNPAAQFFGIRFHPADGDTRLQAVATDGTTPSNTTSTDWNVVNSVAKYYITAELRVKTGNEVRLNVRVQQLDSSSNPAEVTLTKTLASLTTPLGFVCAIVPTVAVAKAFVLNRMQVSMS